MSWASAIGFLVVAAWPAIAAVHFVDGACPTSGTGSQLICGPAGPFKTIGEGVEAMVPGDTLNIRGAHDSYDGVYYEQLYLTGPGNGTLAGKALPCTASAPCVIQGCREDTCGSDETPIVRQMRLRQDWTAIGGGVYERAMEEPVHGPPSGIDLQLLRPCNANADCQGGTCSPSGSCSSSSIPDDARFDPVLLHEGTVEPFGSLAYAGDGVTLPRDGAWSYHPTTNTIRVNPTGGQHPGTTVWVPDFYYGVQAVGGDCGEGSCPGTQYLTLAHMAIQGPRIKGIMATGIGMGKNVDGLVFEDLQIRYVPHHFLHLHSGANILIDRVTMEYGCRGMSSIRESTGGCFSLRTFRTPGIVLRDSIIRHLGAAGPKVDGTGMINCEWCDPPWNDPTHTAIGTNGNGPNIKQTDGATIQGNLISDIQLFGIGYDAVRNVTIENNRIDHVATGITGSTGAAAGSCPPIGPADFCYNNDIVIRANRIDVAGRSNIKNAGIALMGRVGLHPGASFFAKVYNNVVTRASYAGIAVFAEDLSDPRIAPVYLWNNTIQGTTPLAALAPHGTRGIVVRDVLQPGSEIRNNIVSDLTDGLVLNGGVEATLSMDYDLLHNVSGCEVRADIPGWTTADIVPSTGECATLAAFRAGHAPAEAHGLVATPSFVDSGAVPPDVHLRPESSALDAGEDLSLRFGRDVDGETRPSGGGWDIGADEVGGGQPATTTTTMITTSTTLASPGTTSTTVAAPPTTTATTTSSVTSTITTSTLVDGTTTTTLAGDVLLLRGTELVLRDQSHDVGRRRIRVLSKDRHNLPLDPTDLAAVLAEGGTLVVTAHGAHAFRTTYALPAVFWRLIDTSEPTRGVSYRSGDGPITKVVLKAGRRLFVLGSGAELIHPLADEPTVVQVALQVGSRTYCLEFGGKRQGFVKGRRLRRLHANRPDSCLAMASPAQAEEF